MWKLPGLAGEAISLEPNHHPTQKLRNSGKMGSSHVHVPIAFLESTLPQTNMEPEKEPVKKDSSLYRTPFQVPCLFGRVYCIWQCLAHRAPKYPNMGYVGLGVGIEIMVVGTYLAF